MNNNLIIKLIKSNIDEIRNLIVHFQNEEDDLKDGFPLLESRLSSLNKDIEILKLNLSQHEGDFESAPDNAGSENHLNPTNQNKKDIDAKETVTANPIHSDFKHQTEEQTTDKVEQTISTLNDKLQGPRINNLQETIQKSKLKDIQSAIGLNDQFLFIRELFDNKSDEYKSAISYINSSEDDYSKITSYFNKYKEWDNEDVTVIQFFDLIKRKFE